MTIAATDIRTLVAPLTLGEKVLVAGIAYFVLLKALFTFGAFPIADEAYYWLWGQHLALSYFDHPPLQGWLQGLSHAVFGANLFALRFFSIVAFAAILFVFYLTARRIGGERWRTVFLASALAYLASPVFGFFGSVVFIDYLLVALMMGSGYLFFAYFADVETQGRGKLWQLFAAAVLLGLAGLTKYNAGYLGLAVVAAVLFRPKLRPLLLSWPIYAAGLLSVAMLTPVLIWNLQQGFSSFQFHAADRFDASFTGFAFWRMKAFAVDTASLCGPFLIPVIVGFFLRQPRDAFTRVGKTIAIIVFWLSTLTFLYISNYAWVMWWWNIAAFVLVMPFVGRTIHPVLLGLHAIWGGVIQTALVVSFTIVPVTMLAGRPAFMETETGFGWDAIAAAVREAQAEQGATFVGASRYQAASQLAFALDDPDVAELSPRRDAFDDWWDDAAHLGRDAIVIDDRRDHTGVWQARFGAVEKLGEIKTTRLGYDMATYDLYVARDYRGAP